MLRTSSSVGPVWLAALGWCGESIAKPDVKKNFDLSLEKVGPKKIEVIKKVKELYGLGLKEAKDKVDSAPVILKNNLDQATAQDHKEKLEKSGATVQLQ